MKKDIVEARKDIKSLIFGLDGENGEESDEVSEPWNDFDLDFTERVRKLLDFYLMDFG